MADNSQANQQNYFITVDEAKNQISQLIKPLSESEEINLIDALGRVLAEDLTASFATPPYDNSAMDGYALNTASTTESLTIIGQSMAGHPFAGQVKANETVRIMTGAKIPEGADAVVMQELTEKLDDTRIKLTTQVKENENIRFQGEDLSTGDVFLTKGKKLSPIDLAYIATQGIASVKVARKLRVAFFSTGDELRPVGEQLDDGQIFDSNRYSIFGMMANLGAELIDLGIIADVREDIEAAFKQASEQADVIITSGGVSVGDADFVKETLEKEGDIGFWKISMKPGKPLAFGMIHDTVFFGLPGNPVSVIATFYQIVQTAIQEFMGETINPPLLIAATSTELIKKRPGRTDFQRGIISTNDQGELEVKLAGMQASHILTSMSQANCFIVLEKEQGSVNLGEKVMVQPFNGLMS